MAATYTYDAWGNILTKTNHGTSTIADVNPFRYRGYYYDSETGLYYLNARYYDPETGRFLNADAVIGGNVGAAGYNQFAYAGNNPICMQDSNGTVAGVDDAVLLIVVIVYSMVAAFVATEASVTTLPSIQPAWDNFCNTVINGLNNTFENIFGQTSDGTSSSDVQVSSGSDTGSSSKTQTTPKVSNPRNKINMHHMVAKGSMRAIYARTQLLKSGISINDSRNLIAIPAEYHWHLHTNSYYAYVNSVFKNYTGYWVYTYVSIFQKQQDVVRALNEIRAKISFNLLTGSYLY